MVKNNFIAEVTFTLPKWPWPLAKWLSVCLRPNWLWVWIPLQSVKVRIFVKFSSMFLLKRELSDWKHHGKKWNLKDHKSRKLQRNLNMVGTLKQKLETWNGTTKNGHKNHIPISIYLLKVNNRNTGTRCEIYSKLTIKTPERRHWCEICSKLTI